MLVPLLTTSVHNPSRGTAFLVALLGGSVANLSLICIQLPPEYLGKKYVQLVTSMACHYHIPLALYRKSASDQQHYIYTNPKPDTELRADDQVYVSTYLSSADIAKGESVAQKDE
jgi:hypothetical protein